MFRICARTVLELGAELISSDTIAFYELIKNAFDAGSPSGAEIHFQILLRRNNYLEFNEQCKEPDVDPDDLKRDIREAFDETAGSGALESANALLNKAKTPDSISEALDAIYEQTNHIVVSDEGSGMSKTDLTDNYLVIGTPSRKKAIDAALKDAGSRGKPPPFLGEKGIGRLSAMRLGDTLTVETARAQDKRINLLEIDWSDFNDLDALLEEIEIAPRIGGEKDPQDWSGTRLTLGRLTADWTFQRVRDLADHDFARLTDPFIGDKRRPRIAMFWNGTRVPVARMDRNLLAHAHASIKGKYVFDAGEPALECELEASDLGFDHPVEREKRTIPLVDLEGSIAGASGEIPNSALFNLGEFSFECYWFNRRRLSKIDGIGDQETVRKLQAKWAGILLFRDGFRVLPYGEDEDDWLALDRRALGTSSYLLNKAQFVGRVNISRLGNPALVDQTNREGLRVCPEQQAFIAILQLAIQNQLRDFLRDVEKRHKQQPVDLTAAKTDVNNLERRARDAVTKIKRIAPHAGAQVDELHAMFAEIREFFEQAQQRAKEVEGESRQMIHMAGIGLMVEVVAHELARSTEHALAALETLRKEDVPEKIAGLLESLRAEMKAVNKRIRVLDPLSVSGRQRKEVFELGALVEDVLSGHEAQFARHGIQPKLNVPKGGIRVKAVKGMMVQIVENLISNSVYWLDLKKEREPKFQPKIEISLESGPPTLTYEDNGRGIAPENREKVFRAFFSLKEKTKRRGLGLFIARECAEFNGGTLTLDKRPDPQTQRLHRFVLELPEEAEV